MPRITLTSVFVDDQAKALRFYVDVLGFRPRHDVPLGDARWLTVVSPEQPDGPELLPAMGDVVVAVLDDTLRHPRPAPADHDLTRGGSEAESGGRVGL